MATKKDIHFNITSLDHVKEKKLNEIVDKVMKSRKGASALKSMVRSVMRSALKSAIKSVMKSPIKSPMKPGKMKK
jgi:FKBP-type peptidyl-prolyl cis-trans isomerase (trigger factor)